MREVTKTWKVFVVLAFTAAAVVGLFGDGIAHQTAQAQTHIFAVSGVGTGSGPSELYTIDPAAGGADNLIGTITSGGSLPVITDIALAPDGTLFGASFTTLYSINKTTAVATPITLRYSGTAESASSTTLTDSAPNANPWVANQFEAHTVNITGGTGAGQIRQVLSNTTNTLNVAPPWETIPDATSSFEIRKGLGVNSLNALTFSPGGQLLGGTSDGALLSINTSTGQATVIGLFGDGLASSGDLAFSPTGTLFMVAWDRRFSLNDRLVIVDPVTGAATRISKGNIGFDNVFGLAFVGSNLLGLTSDTPRCSKNGAIIKIDPGKAKGTFVRCSSFDAFGATSSP